jgi:hypothetical protein
VIKAPGPGRTGYPSARLVPLPGGLALSLFQRGPKHWQAPIPEPRAALGMDSPRSWVPSMLDEQKAGSTSTVHEVDGQGLHDGSREAARDRDGDGQNQPTQLTSERSRYLRTTVPPTVLVTELDNGVLIIQGRPEGPRVYLSRVDALPLRRELAAAFGSAERALLDDQGEAR